MVFTVIGAVAELERSLIVERVPAGLRNPKAKGKRLGRPQIAVDASRIAALRGERSPAAWEFLLEPSNRRVPRRIAMFAAADWPGAKTFFPNNSRTGSLLIRRPDPYNLVFDFSAPIVANKEMSFL